MSTLFPPSDQSEALREEARRSAQRTSPVFSPALHARIMQAVGKAESSPPNGDAFVPRPAGPFGMIWTIAAVAVLAVEVVVVVKNQPVDTAALALKNEGQSQTVQADEPLAEVSEVQAVPGQVTLAMETAVSRQQWAGLDRDAKSVTRYLANQVPFQSVWNSP